MASPLNIPLGEEFLNRAWVNYDAYDPETKEHLAFQNHVDIRTFTNDSQEGWTEGVFGTQSTIGNYPGILLAVTNEVTTETSSQTLKHTVDLLTGFASTDLITFALPSFPLADVNIGQSYIDITSDPEGNFAHTEVSKSLPFSATTVSLIEGNSQFLVTRSEFEGGEIDLENITAVRFRVRGSGTANVIIMGLKLILAGSEENPKEDPGWVRSSVDYDNWNGRLRKPVPVNGDVDSGAVFDQSILWRAAKLPGVEGGGSDPTPIDAEMGIVIYTGSQENNNSFSLYLREESEIFQNQLDLTGVTMAELDGHPQPDLGTSEFLPRPIGEFDKDEMEELDRFTMLGMERTAVANPIEQSWVYFELNWGPDGSSFTAANSTTPGYVFPTLGAALKNKTYYLLICSLENDEARATIYPLNPDFSVIQKPIFDTTVLSDDGVFRRRKGRVGWQASLGDGDSFVQSIRPRGVCFAEYQSAPLTSVTPVAGAQLYANFTPNTELWNKGLKQLPAGSKAAIASRDSVRSLSGESFKLNVLGIEGNQGWTTDPIEFTDFSQMEIKFALWFPGSARTVERTVVKHRPTLPSKKLFPSPELFPSKGYTEIKEPSAVPNIIAQLVSTDGTIYPLHMPEIEPEQWQHISLSILPGEIIQTGVYSLQIIQPPKKSATWWLDEISIFQRAIQWSARSVVDDPWMSNYAPWTDFREIVNVNNSGIILSPRGKELQLRAKALRQDATILHAPTIKPRYAELGRLVWPENELTGKVPPIAKFEVIEGIEKSFTFVDESTPGTGAIISREYSFGDGTRATGNNSNSIHKYAENGTFTMTLVVTDRNGLRGVAHKPITVH